MAKGAETDQVGTVAAKSTVAWLKTNVASKAQARKLARGALEARLAACANLEPIESFYWWKGRIRRADETAVVFKTAPGRLRQLRAWVDERHPYEVPYIAWGDEPVPARYARWATAAVAGRQTRRSPSSRGSGTPRTR